VNREGREGNIVLGETNIFQQLVWIKNMMQLLMVCSPDQMSAQTY